jgi:hypothetical protein
MVIGAQEVRLSRLWTKIGRGTASPLTARNRRRLMVTCDGAGARHGLIEHLDELACGTAGS